MKANRFHLIALTSVMLALGILFGACGSAPDTTPGTTPTHFPTTAPTSPTAPSPVPTDPTAVPPTPVPTRPASGCTDQASFVGDVTVPDDTVVPAGRSFVKTWRLRNSGTCTWTTVYALDFVRGDRLGGPFSAALPGTVAPGSTVDLSVTLTAPAGAGTYRGWWKLRNAGGSLFGVAEDDGTVLVRIVVPAVSQPTAPAPTATPAPTIPPTVVPTPVIEGWRGEYYGNLHLAGAPLLVRDDETLDFDWHRHAPAAGLPTDHFSVRWTRTMEFSTVTYRFHLLMDDGARLYVDDQLIIDEWRDGEAREVAVEWPMQRGAHTLRVEYYDHTGEARIHLWWEKARAVFPEWKGEYWPNTNLQGDPDLVRNDVAVDFDWDIQSPDPAIPDDEFSARWTRTVEFAAGTYRFRLVVDDGARLYVDDRLVIDEWRAGSVREATAELALKAGSHQLRVEYFDQSFEAQIHFDWEKVQRPTSGWQGEYWSNRHMQGRPALVRDDAAIDFNWHRGMPAAGLPEDGFAVRWTREVTFEPGTYTFYAQANDGLRFYLDGRLLLQAGPGDAGKEVHVAGVALGGPHQLQVEYWDQEGKAQVKFWWQPAGAPQGAQEMPGKATANQDLPGRR